MKASESCYLCLANLVRQAAGLATEDQDLRKRAIEECLALLDREFSLDRTTIRAVTPLHRLIKQITGNPDPYASIKEAEILMARRVIYRLRRVPRTFRGCLVFAARGNNIDFFQNLDYVVSEIRRPVRFVIDQSEDFQRRLKGAAKVLYLADNAGEVPFDLPLVQHLGCHTEVTYVVKGGPVQDDITLDDLRKFGLAEYLPRVISTGTETPGVDMEFASAEFKGEFERADLVLAKGMGYWETLSELAPEGKVFYLLKAKCEPVALSLGVNLNSYLAFFR